MTPIQWTPALAIGVPEIDAQHQELFRRADELIVALRGGDRSAVSPVVRFLAEYAKEHFASEERFMQEIGYPGLEAHRMAHEAFRDQLAELAADFQRKGPTALVALSVHNWLSDWLRRHVSGLDVEIGRFAEARRRGK